METLPSGMRNKDPTLLATPCDSLVRKDMTCPLRTSVISALRIVLNPASMRQRLVSSIRNGKFVCMKLCTGTRGRINLKNLGSHSERTNFSSRVRNTMKIVIGATISGMTREVAGNVAAVLCRSTTLACGTWLRIPTWTRTTTQFSFQTTGAMRYKMQDLKRIYALLTRGIETSSGLTAHGLKRRTKKFLNKMLRRTHGIRMARISPAVGHDGVLTSTRHSDRHDDSRSCLLLTLLRIDYAVVLPSGFPSGSSGSSAVTCLYSDRMYCVRRRTKYRWQPSELCRSTDMTGHVEVKPLTWFSRVALLYGLFPADKSSLKK